MVLFIHSFLPHSFLPSTQLVAIFLLQFINLTTKNWKAYVKNKNRYVNITIQKLLQDFKFEKKKLKIKEGLTRSDKAWVGSSGEATPIISSLHLGFVIANLCPIMFPRGFYISQPMCLLFRIWDFTYLHRPHIPFPKLLVEIIFPIH